MMRHGRSACAFLDRTAIHDASGRDANESIRVKLTHGISSFPFKMDGLYHALVFLRVHRDVIGMRVEYVASCATGS
jgi:hypothetical protein